MNANADVIVVGLGAMGSAISFQLAKRGATVIGFDRYAPPHDLGSTHGDSRITRLAIGEGAEYAPLVRRSHELWRELEDRSGVQLLTQCGGLILAPRGNAFLEQTRATAREYSIEHEDLANPALADQFPMFVGDEQTEAYFEPEAGYVRPEPVVRAHLDLARVHGSRLHFGEAVKRWRASPRRVTVSTDVATYEADRLVLSVGPWVGELLDGADATFAVYRQLLYWFPVSAHFEQLRDMPVFVWDFGGERDEFVHFHGFYGFPAIDGPGGGVKVATEAYERTTVPDGRQHPATAAETERMYSEVVGPRLRWLGDVPLRTASCLYTSTRASRFVIDWHPEHERVLVVSACSGHGFKHSAAIGEAVAQLVSTGACELDLADFTFDDARRF